jgi:hypothetical protein
LGLFAISCDFDSRFPTHWFSTIRDLFLLESSKVMKKSVFSLNRGLAGIWRWVAFLEGRVGVPAVAP